MRIRFLTALAIMTSSFLFAQDKFCGTTEMQNKWFAEHPDLKQQFDQLQTEASNLDAEQFSLGYPQLQQRAAASGNYTIPVVFHILHTGGGENISDAQVQDAVNILTRDFNKQNADTIDVVLAFKNLIGNAQIEFHLATKDPNGNCTNGIVRHWDTKTDWSGNFNDYIYTWPSTKYLNVYVVKTIGSGAAGYTYLPGSGIPAAADAIVILNGYVGSVGTGNSGTSRALTHEVGHWLNLPHVWGGTNQPGVACGDDGVADTPISKGYSSCSLGSPIFCTPGVVENIQNYMEYAYCQRMYTIGQATRMQNAINSPVSGRNNLSTPNNLAATGIVNPATNCIPDLNINVLPSFSVCSGKALSFNSFTFNANPTTYSWSANNGATVLNTNTTTASITFNNVGSSTVSCLVSNAFGSNSKSIVVTVLSGVTDVTTTASESFENVALPANWTVINPTTPNQQWERFPGIGSNGTNCMYVPTESLTPNSIEILESPSFDFKNNPGALFTFKYAYAKDNPLNKDLFKVQGSKNCGSSWQDIWVPSNSSLANNSGGTTSSLFFPTQSFEWVLYDLTAHPNFQSFNNEEHVTFRFYFQEDIGGTGFGNRIYLDEINFTTPVGINEITKSISLNVFPNPTNSIFNLSFVLAHASKIKYTVSSIDGSAIISEEEKLFSEGAHELKINENQQLKHGIYFLNLEMNGVKMSKKIIIN